jgi:hypothetical protein
MRDILHIDTAAAGPGGAASQSAATAAPSRCGHHDHIIEILEFW